VTNPYLNDHEQPTQPSGVPAVPTQPHVAPVQVQAQPPMPAVGQLRPRRRRRLQGCLTIGFVATLILLFACAASLALYVVFPPAPLNILVMGLDSRGEEGTTTRTDSIMVVGIHPATINVSLLSIPRDLFIDVPGYGLQRINTVNVLAEIEEPGTGPDLLEASIEQNFDFNVSRYVRLDFQAFVEVVDAVGGLNIDVPYQIVDTQFPTPDYGTMTVRFEPGLQHMDGATALIYARTRHSDDDYRRAERQQQVVSALAGKLINPFRWPGAWAALSRNVETDLSPLDLVPVLPPLIFSGGQFDTLVINRDWILPGNGYSYPNYEALDPWIEERYR